MDPQSTAVAPLSAQPSCLEDPLTLPMVPYSPADPARCLLQTDMHSHACSIGTPHLWIPPNTHMNPPDTPARSQSHSLASSAWELWVNTQAHLMHTPQFLSGPSISIWRFLALSLFIPCLTVCVPVLLSFPLLDYYSHLYWRGPWLGKVNEADAFHIPYTNRLWYW